MGRRNQNRPPKKPRISVPDFPTVDNCDPNDPTMYAVWALVGLPGQNGAPLPLPVKILRLVSRRLWDAGFRYHPELRTIKYRKPRVGDPHFLSNPGTWVPIDDPEPGEEAAKKLSPEQKAQLRERFGLDDDPPKPKVPGPPKTAPDEKVPYLRKDGTTVMVTPSQARRWAAAKRARKEAGK
ncbi:DUF2744 domain-containing protein [Gordonia sp. HY285]|uniref:phage gene 29 protein family protein n=1 Tax=Gordonia liuliyuniae TaxID=2911517 RepID=UPI001F485AA5|nr:DUF2744 domain-containing protein [Gordonia liuliyuniae]MCF8610070.1 DUF2744 domain-containing protein [Gordonia liuliyuniae]